MAGEIEEKASEKYDAEGKIKAKEKYEHEGREKAKQQYESGGRKQAEQNNEKGGREKAEAKFVAEAALFGSRSVFKAICRQMSTAMATRVRENTLRQAASRIARYTESA